MNLTASLAAAQNHGTVFFTHDLQPVAPQAGDWFCEYDVFGDDELRDEELVEYLGRDTTHTLDAAGEWVSRGIDLVCPEDGEARQPRGIVLVRQGY